jgi:hypothetical protein
MCEALPRQQSYVACAMVGRGRGFSRDIMYASIVSAAAAAAAALLSTAAIGVAAAVR